MEHSPDNMINEIDKVVGGTPYRRMKFKPSKLHYLILSLHMRMICQRWKKTLKKYLNS